MDDQNIAGSRSGGRDWGSFGASGQPVTTKSTTSIDGVDKTSAATLGLPVIKDTREKAEEGDKTESIDPKRPVLTPPDPHDPAVANAALAKLFDPQTMAKIFDQGPTDFVAAAEESFAADASSITVTDPEVIRAAQEQGISPQVLQKGIQEWSTAQLKSFLDHLPPDMANRFRLAFAFPETAGTLTVEQQALIQGIKNAINTKAALQFGLRPEWPGQEVNVTSLKESIVLGFDKAFREALQQAIDTADPPLTNEQIAKLKTLYYAPPGVTLTQDPVLLGIFTSIKDQMTNVMQAKYSYDDSWKPPVDTEYYTSILNGAFCQHFKEAAAHYDPPLTKEDALNIDKFAPKYFANSGDPSIPADVKTILANLVAAANATVIKEFGLDPAWKANVTAINPPGMDMGAFTMAQNALKSLNDMRDAIEIILPSIPPSPERQRLENYLKLIGEAITELQEALYAMQDSRANTARILTRLRMAISDDNIKQKEKAAADVKAEEGKLEKVIPINDIMDVVTKVSIIAAACVVAALLSSTGVGMAVGAIIIAAAIAYVTASVVAPGFVEKAFAEIQAGCIEFGKAIGGPCGEEFGRVLGAVVNLYVALVLGTGNPMLTMQLMTKDCKAIEEIAGVCGANENEIKICSAVIGGVAQVAMAVAMSVMSFGATSAAAIGTVANALHTTEKTIRTVIKVAQTLQTLFTLTTTAISGYNSYVEYNNNMVYIDINWIKAKSEVLDEDQQAIMKSLRQLLDKIQSLFQGTTDLILDLSKTNSAKWTQASMNTTELFS